MSLIENPTEKPTAKPKMTDVIQEKIEEHETKQKENGEAQEYIKDILKQIRSDEKNHLTDQEQFIVICLINIYEFIIGYFIGIITNEIGFRIIQYLDSESMLKSILMICLIGIPSITLLLQLRKYVQYLPGLRQYNLSNKTNFKMPPPVALTFGFWSNQSQLKLRNANLHDQILNKIRSTRDILSRISLRQISKNEIIA